MSNADSSENEVAMDEVVEERPAAKKTSYLGTIIFLILLALIAGAAWYFQSMWLPQTKQTYQQVRTQVNDFISPKKVDPMAAPGLDSVKQADSDEKPEYAVSAIIDPVEKTEESIAPVTKEVVPVVPAVPVEEVDIASEKSAKENTDDVVAGVEEKPAAEEKPVAEEKPAAEEKPVAEEKSVAEEKPETETESVAQATFIDDAEAPKVMEAPEPVVAKDDAMEQSALENKSVMENKKHEVDLAEARQAFWQRNLPKAEALYKQQIENAKANADSWGELGNVYYLQAKWQQAAMAYTEAALLLLNKGDFPQAMYMRYIVVGLDPVQAKRIDDHIKTLQAPLKG